MIPATKIPSLKAPRESHFGRISKNLRTSFFWAWLDTICRYRRSRIGPLWETINVFVMVVGVTLVSSSIMGGRDILSSMPYVGLGIICWSAISSIINSASTTFIRHAGQIRCSSMSIDLYVGRVVFGSLITFCHHCLLYIIGLLLLPIHLDWYTPLALVGIFLVYLNAFWVTSLLGFLCARFRDLEQIVQNSVQLAFFVTPVFWHHDALSGNRRFIVDYNPLFYLLRIMREPLLGQLPPLYVYLMVLGITVIGYGLLFITYRKMRAHLAFYV